MTDGEESVQEAKLTGSSNWFMKKKDDGSLLAGGEGRSPSSTPPDERRSQVPGETGARRTMSETIGKSEEDKTRQVEAVLFVPHNTKEELRKKLQEKEDELARVFNRKRVKIRERGGPSLESMLCRKNPWGEVLCERSDCRVCE